MSLFKSVIIPNSNNINSYYQAYERKYLNKTSYIAHIIAIHCMNKDHYNKSKPLFHAHLSHLHKSIYRSDKQKHKQKPQLNHHPYRKLKKVSWLV